MFRALKVDSALRIKIKERLSARSEVIRFEEDPAFASLCCSLALRFEVGNRDYDRLSPFFGVDIQNEGEDSWQSEIISPNDRIGLSLTPRDGRELEIRHPDFRYIIDRESFDKKGRLSRIVLFPP